jgi:AraC-like DNA-binding protein
MMNMRAKEHHCVVGSDSRGRQIMPHGRVFEFDDPYNLQATLRAGNYEVFPLSKGSFRAELTRVDFEDLWLQRCDTSANVLLHTANDQARTPMTFLADPDQGPWQQNGGELPPDGIAVYRRGAVNHHLSREPNRWASMSLTPDALAAYGDAIAGRELTAPRETYIARPGSQRMARLRSLHAAACHLAKSNPEALACRATARSLEEDLVHAMVACLAAELPAVSNSRRIGRARVMSRFEDYLADRPCEPLYLSEICAAIGVAERTLRDCCQDHLGMGPIHYLWLRRMHLARHALRDTDPAHTSVTEIATAHGFWELGRFAVEYRNLFDESPSTTLRRSTV